MNRRQFLTVAAAASFFRYETAKAQPGPYNDEPPITGRYYLAPLEDEGGVWRPVGRPSPNYNIVDVRPNGRLQPGYCFAWFDGPSTSPAGSEFLGNDHREDLTPGAINRIENTLGMTHSIQSRRYGDVVAEVLANPPATNGWPGTNGRFSQRRQRSEVYQGGLIFEQPIAQAAFQWESLFADVFNFLMREAHAQTPDLTEDWGCPNTSPGDINCDLVWIRQSAGLGTVGIESFIWSNKCRYRAQSSGAFKEDHWRSSNTVSVDHRCELNIDTVPGSGTRTTGVNARSSPNAGENTFYRCRCPGTNPFELQRMQSNSGTPIATGVGSLSAGNRVAIEADGPTITATLQAESIVQTDTFLDGSGAVDAGGPHFGHGVYLQNSGAGFNVDYDALELFELAAPPAPGSIVPLMEQMGILK